MFTQDVACLILLKSDDVSQLFRERVTFFKHSAYPLYIQIMS